MSVTWVVGGKNRSGTAQIAYSTNGTTYTNSSNTTTIFGSDVRGIAHNGTIWVAVGYAAGISGAVTTGYSYDANTWYASSSGYSILTYINSVEYGNGKFVAVGDGPNHIGMYSTDGINWTGNMPKSVFLTSSNFGWGVGAVYRNATWVAFGGSGATNRKTIAYSTDAINWTFPNPTVISSEIRSIDYNGTVWVAVGLNLPSPTVEVIYTTDITSSWNNSIAGYSKLCQMGKWQIYC